MKIVKATDKDKDVLAAFLPTNVEAGGEYDSLPCSAEYALGEYVCKGNDIYLVTDPVDVSPEDAVLYTSDNGATEVLAGVITVVHPKAVMFSRKGHSIYPKVRTMRLVVAPQYKAMVSMMLMLKDFVEHVVFCGIPYRTLWLPQSNEDDPTCEMFCQSVTNSDLATGYLTQKEAEVAGYCIDLRCGHYIAKAMKRLAEKEG